jgi:hypothetical protein
MGKDKARSTFHWDGVRWFGGGAEPGKYGEDGFAMIFEV